MSKLSFHIHDISRCGFWLLPITRRSGLQWIKHIAFNADNPNYGDGIRVIVRPWIGGDGVEARYITEGGYGARRYWAENETFIRLLSRWAFAIEGPNEPYVGAHEARCNLSQFTYELASIYRSAGIKFVAGNFSVGNPSLDPDALTDLLDVLMLGDYLGMHHYGRPTMDSADPYELWRYRYLRDAMPGLPPILLTEYGVDGTGTPMGQNGWRKSYKRFKVYLADLMDCNAQLEHDGIECAFLFDVGGDRKWRSFNHERAEVEDILEAQGLL